MKFVTSRFFNVRDPAEERGSSSKKKTPSVEDLITPEKPTLMRCTSKTSAAKAALPSLDWGTLYEETKNMSEEELEAHLHKVLKKKEQKKTADLAITGVVEGSGWLEPKRLKFPRSDEAEVTPPPKQRSKQRSTRRRLLKRSSRPKARRARRRELMKM